MSVGPLFNVLSVQASGLKDNLKEVGGTAYYDDKTMEPSITDPSIMVGNIIKIVLGLTGVLFTILIIVSGFQWMTAGGNKETIIKAKGRIINAAIGLIIVLAVFSITTFVLQKVFITTGLYTP